jgi:hypothetical protein
MTDAKTERQFLRLAIHLLGERGIELTVEEAQLSALKYADVHMLDERQLKRLCAEFYDAIRFDKGFRIEMYRPKREEGDE